MTAMHYPLAGLTVVDLGQIYNGPYATFLMAMAGARVIKIEPHGGEHLRRRGVVGGAALPFAMLNSNKLAVTLDLKSERGKALLLDMARRADVLLENFAPGTTERLGIGWERVHAVNPRLVYASSSGYGLSGPHRNYPAMDLTVQAMAGVMSVTGYPDRPPVKAGPAICDFFAGVHLYAGVVTALYEREQTGVGRRVEVSMQEAVYASLSSNLGLWLGNSRAAAELAQAGPSGADGAGAVSATGGNLAADTAVRGGAAEIPERTGNRHGGLAESPYNVYPTRDGWIAIICVGETHWKSLIVAMQRPDLADDSRFASLASRVANMDVVDDIVSSFTRRYHKQALFDLLMKHRVPCAPVRTLSEVVNDPHLHARGAVQWVDHPELGRVPLPNSPLRFDGVEPMPLVPSRRLGADNRRVYGDWLGLGADQIAALEKDGVI